MKTKMLLKRSATLNVHTKTSEHTDIIQDFENIKRLQTINSTDLYAKNITRTNTCMHACMLTHTHVSWCFEPSQPQRVISGLTHTCIQAQTHAYMHRHTCIHAQTHAYTHTHTHTCTETRTCTLANEAVS